MPQSIHDGLLDQMQLSFPDEFVYTESATAGPIFPCMHFVYYNWYSIHVEYIFLSSCEFLDANFFLGYSASGS